LSIFNKPLSQIDLTDVDGLIQSKTPEGINLDYKSDLDGSPKDKKEIAKDVSAMANSQGGYIIYGILEEKQVPKSITGVPRLISSQPVQEWLAQIIASGIAQRPAFEMSRALECSHDINRVVLVLYVPPSAAAPHMVTSQNDNRYHKRHKYQSLPAEEYEVRDMFMRSLRFLDLMERTFEEHHLQDIEDPEFGLCRYAKELQPHETSEERLVKFLAVPRLLQRGNLDTGGGEFLDWIQPHNHRYPPMEDFFMPKHALEVTLDGFWLFNVWEKQASRYLHIYRNGAAEYASLASAQDMYLFPKEIARRLTSFLGFLANLADFSTYYSDYEVALAVRGTLKTKIHLYQEKHKEEEEDYGIKLCRYPNILVRLTVSSTELRAGVDAIANKLMVRFSNAYGYQDSVVHDKEGKLIP